MVTWLPQNEISRSNYLVFLLLSLLITKTQTLIIHETSTCPRMSRCFLLDQLPFESACLLGPFRTYFGLQGMLVGWIVVSGNRLEWKKCECRAKTCFHPAWATKQTAKLIKNFEATERGKFLARNSLLRHTLLYWSWTSFAIIL